MAYPKEHNNPMSIINSFSSPDEVALFPSLGWPIGNADANALQSLRTHGP